MESCFKTLQGNLPISQKTVTLKTRIELKEISMNKTDINQTENIFYELKTTHEFTLGTLQLKILQDKFIHLWNYWGKFKVNSVQSLFKGFLKETRMDKTQY